MQIDIWGWWTLWLKVCPVTVQAEVYSTEQNHVAELLRGDTVGGAQAFAEDSAED